MIEAIVNWAVTTVIAYVLVMGTALLSYMAFQDIVEKGRRK